MKNIINAINGFVRNDEGQDLIEYALLAALIALAAVVMIRAAGVEVNAIFERIVGELSTAVS